MKVLAKPEVIDYLEELISILYEKEYFGYEEFAIRYVGSKIFRLNYSLLSTLNFRTPDLGQT